MATEEEDEDQPAQKFPHPATFMITGATGRGKSFFTARLLIESMFVPMPTRIVWVYSEWQRLYECLQQITAIEFIKGLPPDLYDSFSPQVDNLLVLDDQMGALGNSSALADFFTKGSHHRNLTVIFILQNIVHQGRAMRDTALNTQITILFGSPRDVGQIARLGYQMFPSHKLFLPQAFKDATAKIFGYLVIDTHPKSDPKSMVRTKIFPGEKTIVYVPN